MGTLRARRPSFIEDAGEANADTKRRRQCSARNIGRDEGGKKGEGAGAGLRVGIRGGEGARVRGGSCAGTLLALRPFIARRGRKQTAANGAGNVPRGTLGEMRKERQKASRSRSRSRNKRRRRSKSTRRKLRGYSSCATSFIARCGREQTGVTVAAAVSNRCKR